MEIIRRPAAHLEGLTPYDPRFLPAKAYLSANESPFNLEEGLRRQIAQRIATLEFNRYPDPLANGLRDQIAQANELKREQVLVGNGGDELLFAFSLVWGGPGRTFLTMPPTFSVYEANARITNTQVIEIPRKQDFALDEKAVFARVAQGDIDFTIITSPNNPTGNLADTDFILRLLESADTMVMVDEAYGDFGGASMLPHLAHHKNLIILRTFSKAYSLAGARLGYIIAHPDVVTEFIKVRQPYSVDAVSQIIGSCVFERRTDFDAQIAGIAAQRDRVYQALSAMEEVSAFPSAANFILFKVENAGSIWESLYGEGVLVRDFSRAPGLHDCLRVSIGTEQENTRFLAALEKAIAVQKLESGSKAAAKAAAGMAASMAPREKAAGTAASPASREKAASQDEAVPGKRTEAGRQEHI